MAPALYHPLDPSHRVSPRVVVVGAGPAGSVAALCLARSGVSVLLLERAELPRRKVCGGCVGPGALGLLEALGVAGSLRRAGGRPFSSLELLAGTSRRARAGRAHLALGPSIAVTRATLDRILVDAAREAGVEVRDGARVYGLRIADDGVDVELGRRGGSQAPLRVGALVDASGLGGLTVEPSGSATVHGRGATGTSVAPDSRVGVGALFRSHGIPSLPQDVLGSPSERLPSSPADGVLRMVVGRGGYVGMVGVEGGRLNVAAALDRSLLAEGGPGGAVRRILAEVGCALPDDDPELGWKGTPALTRRPSSAAGPRIFRVGDAAGYVEPFTGEGIGWAVSSGILVAPFVREALAGRAEQAARGWSGEYVRLVARRQRTCRILAAGLRRPRLVAAAIGLLSPAPWLAGPLVRLTRRAPRPALEAATSLSGAFAVGSVS